MKTLKNELIYTNFKLNEDFLYEDIFKIIQKDIVNFDIIKLENAIVTNPRIRELFLEYFLINKGVLKDSIWSQINSEIIQKKGKAYNYYLKSFFSRMYDFCYSDDDFQFILTTMPEFNSIFKDFLEMIFICYKDIEKIYNEVSFQLLEEKKYLEKEDYLDVFKYEFSEKIKELNL